jgi:hypothetical protein
MTKSLFRVTDTAPDRVHGLRLPPGGLLNADPDAVRYEVDLGYLVRTTIEDECRPLVGLTDAERAALPPLGDSAAENAVGPSKGRKGAGTGVVMTGIPMEPDGAGGFIGTLTEPAPEAGPEV